MSHLHSIAGNSRAAAEYQEYLERIRAARLADEEEKIRKKARTQTFESYINRDRNSRGNSHRNPGREAKKDSANEADPTEGFGTRYA